jgi:signal transduction histidine kinase
MAISILVMGSWFIDFTKALYLIPEGASMKFNTAFLFLVVSACLLFNKNSPKGRTARRVGGVILIVLSFLTLIEYIFHVDLGIDNLIILDQITTRFPDRIPGRMSAATATCFLLFGIGQLILDNSKKIILEIAQTLFLAVILISLVSSIAYLMIIPISDRTSFWDTMAIHTSLFFMISAFEIALKNRSIGFVGVVTGPFAGSRLIRNMLPIILLLPLSFSYLLLFLTEKELLDVGFAMTLFAVLFILSSLIYVSVLSLRMNVKDENRSHLEKMMRVKNKELEQYAFIASHDLQEPLTTMSGFADLFEKRAGKKLDEDELKYLEYIKQGSKRMSNLIKGILNYSRLGTSGKLETIDCNVLVNEVTADLRDLIKTAEGQVDVRNLPEIKGYRPELRLVFQNLISNALKFHKPERPPLVTVSAVRERDYWRFFVKDNGIGLPQEHSEKVFNLFQRLHPRHEYDGTGIGLTYCQKIVEIHDGEISVKSVAGAGTTFTFTISVNL